MTDTAPDRVNDDGAHARQKGVRKKTGPSLAQVFCC